MNGGDQAFDAAEEEAAIQRIRDAQRRRLLALKEAAAAQGIDTPPHVIIEITKLERALGLAIAAIANGEVAEVFNAATPGQRTAALAAEVTSTGRHTISSLATMFQFSREATERQFETLERKVMAALGDIDERIDRRLTGMEDHIDHQFTRRDTWLLLFAVMVFLLTLIVAMIVTYLYLV